MTAADLTREQLAAEIERLEATLIATPYSSDNWDAAERDLVACLIGHTEEIVQALRDAARAEALEKAVVTFVQTPLPKGEYQLPATAGAHAVSVLGQLLEALGPDARRALDPTP